MLGVAEVGVGLVLDDGGLAGDFGWEEAAEGIGFGLPALWIFLMTGRPRFVETRPSDLKVLMSLAA